MLRCDRSQSSIATVAGYGKNVNTKKVYCRACLAKLAELQTLIPKAVCDG